MKTNSTLIVVLITFLVYFAILIIFLSRHNYNPGTLIHIGSKFIENAYVDPKLPVNYEYGYDGQFYYRLALEPSYRDSSHGPYLDAPAYRMQRIFYPLLVHILSFGKRNIVPVNLIIVNILFLCFIALAGSKLSESKGFSPYYGLAFSFYPGFVFSLIVDTPEAVFTGLILLSLLTIRLQRHLLTTLFLTMALLTRETTLIVILSILFTITLQTLFKNPNSNFKLKWHNAIIPLVVFLLWQTYIFFRWGHLSFAEGYGNLGMPFAGFLTAYLNLIKSADRSCNVFIWLFDFWNYNAYFSYSFKGISS